VISNIILAIGSLFYFGYKFESEQKKFIQKYTQDQRMLSDLKESIKLGKPYYEVMGLQNISFGLKKYYLSINCSNMPEYLSNCFFTAYFDQSNTLLHEIFDLGLTLDYIPQDSPISILYHMVTAKEESLENNNLIIDVLLYIYKKDSKQVSNALLQEQTIQSDFNDSDTSITVLSYLKTHNESLYNVLTDRFLGCYSLAHNS
jgi:hypothetical protein